MSTKICSICKQEKKLNCFNIKTSTKDGYDNACRSCRTKRIKELQQIRSKITITEKICSRCGKLQPITEYYNCRSTTDGYRGQCKSCYAELDKIYKENMTLEQKEQRKQYERKYTKEHKEQLKQYQKEYRKKNTEKLQQMEIERHKNNRLNKNMSIGIYQALKENKAERHWETLVLYNLQQLKEHLEQQFTSEMSWDNYGSYWEIDHIIPQNLFNITDEKCKDFQICWSFANLRPLPIVENRQRPKDGSDVSKELKQQILQQYS